MKYWSSYCCDKCGNKLLISGDKIVCVYCDTEEQINEQTTTKSKRKKPHQNVSDEGYIRTT